MPDEAYEIVQIKWLEGTKLNLGAELDLSLSARPIHQSAEIRAQDN